MSLVVREMRPSAVVVDLLGDFNRIGGREVRLKSLVALGEAIGVSGPSMRVTLARLRERGWFDVRRQGRESVYQLTTKCRRILTDGGHRLLRPHVGPWSGEWDMVIYAVPETDRNTRDELRRHLAGLGFGTLAPSTWVSPRRRMDELVNATTHLSAARLTLLSTRTAGLDADRALSARCWDLDAFATGYRRFVAEIGKEMSEYELDALDGRDAFVERLRLLRRYRDVTEGDPMLPPELLPVGWPGDQARDLFGRVHDGLAARAREFYVQALDLNMYQLIDGQRE